MKRKTHSPIFIAVISTLFSTSLWAQNDVEKGFFDGNTEQQVAPAAPAQKSPPTAKPAPSTKPLPTLSPPAIIAPPINAAAPVTYPATPNKSTYNPDENLREVKTGDQRSQELQEPSINYVPPGSGESHPFFDWSKHKDETLVAHPLADKGLVEVTKDKTYIYKVEPSPQDRAMSIHVGMYDPSNLRNPSGDASDTFANNYSPNNIALFIEYEWQLWRIGIGKLGITAGAGAYVAQGHGHFANPSVEPPGLVPMENFTLAVIPITGGAIYRMQVWDRQLFVPYGGGGIELIPFTELRDDGYGPRVGGSVAAYAAAGVAFNLTYFDKLAALALDREYGINRVYLTAEFRDVINLDPHYDFGGTILNGGLTAEF